MKCPQLDDMNIQSGDCPEQHENLQHLLADQRPRRRGKFVLGRTLS